MNYLPCQYWNIETPNVAEDEFKPFEDRQKTNYCSNDNNTDEPPWCFYQNKKGWKYCFDLCPETIPISTTTTTTTTSTTFEWILTTLEYSTVSVA